jgi:hypothetical protein
MIERVFIAALALAVCFFAAPADAACTGGFCYVRGGLGTGNSGTNTTFSITNTSGASCACTPATTDVVVLDSGSNGTNFTLNSTTTYGAIDASGTVAGSNANGNPFTGTITHSNTITVTIGGNTLNALKFSAGMTYAPANSSANFTFTPASGGPAGITTAGQNLSAITINATAGISVQQQDDLNMTATGGTLNITQGTFDANGHVTAASIIQSTAANTRAVILGSAVKIGSGNVASNTNIWNFSTAGTLTFTKGTANIEVVSPTSATQEWGFAGGGVPAGYNGLTLDNNTAGGSTLSMSGSNSFTNITVGSGWNLSGNGGLTQTLSGNLAVTGTSGNWSGLQSNSVASQITYSVGGTCTMAYTVLTGIAITGAASGTCTATNSVNLTTNTGFSSISQPTVGTGGSRGIIGG